MNSSPEPVRISTSLPGSAPTVFSIWPSERWFCTLSWTGTAQSVRGDQQHAVVPAFHPVEVLERFPVLLEAGSGHEILQ